MAGGLPRPGPDRIRTASVSALSRDTGLRDRRGNAALGEMGALAPLVPMAVYFDAVGSRWAPTAMAAGLRRPSDPDGPDGPDVPFLLVTWGVTL